ncbi:DUF5696 domain-containing protein [Bacillus sp. FSL K6-3431]|uniref:DUF5696 domain-containing protein n=1 Tax=Bacillus sp. FSL K6-3431 TaxID=2921500 RepID=UPI0030FB1C1F
MSRKIRFISSLCILFLLIGLNPMVHVVAANTEDNGESESAEGLQQSDITVDNDQPKINNDAVNVTGKVNSLNTDDMKVVVSNDKLELYFNEKRLDFAVKDLESGKVWYSNPIDRDSDPIAVAENKGMLYAQLALTYFNPNGQTTRLDSYRDSVQKEQFEFEQIENGIKIIYTFGNASKGIEQLPRLISKDRFQSLILDKIDDEKQRKDVEKRYKYIEEEDVYERRDNTFRDYIIDRTVQLFEEIGYTEEELAKDNDEHEVELEEELSFPYFVIPLIVQLEEDNVVVRIEGSELEYNPVYPISTLQVLPFFGAAGQNDDGYMFVPDGSGALIELNNGKSQYQPYKARVYGNDEAIFERTNSLISESIRLPVFGMKQGNHAFISIIEEGDGIAAIEADVSGRLNSYNTVSHSFIIKESSEFTLAGGERSNTISIFQKGDFKENLTIRYAFLEGKDANYAGMASYYQRYLIDNHQLEPLTKKDDIPFYLELTGSIWKRNTFLGIPYKSLEPLTTFEEAEKIVKELLDSDISNLKVRYMGWFNDGVNHKIPKKVEVDNEIGGLKGLQEFTEFLTDNNIELYPDVAFSNVYRKTIDFSPTKDASRFITKKVAEVFPTNRATYRQDLANRTSYYLLSPTKLPTYVNEFITDYDKFNIKNLSLRDLGERIHSDYKEKKVINREQSKQIGEEQMSKLNDLYPNLLTIGGNAPVLPYAKSILDVPLSSSGFNITDRSIPFYQMVLHGYIDYAGSPVNLAADQNIQYQILKSLETGSNVYFNWFYEEASTIKETEFNHLISSNFQLWQDDAILMYKTVNSVLNDVRDKPITSHKELARGIYETTYGHHFSIIVNYNEHSAVVDGMTIEAESYKIRQGE